MIKATSTFRDCLETAYRGTADYSVFALDIEKRRQKPAPSPDIVLEQFASASRAKLALVGRWHDESNEVRLGMVFVDREEFPGEHSSSSIKGFIKERLYEMAGEALYSRIQTA